MATLGQPSPTGTQRPSRKSCARKCERCCCSTIIYFPLVFVYGLTTWAVWVQVSIGLLPARQTWTGFTSAFVGVAFYILLNWSYTTAVFTDPGSSSRPFNNNGTLPNYESPALTSFTAKYNGEIRFCKKCQARKPDRAHHCSTCRRCVLQMDHHCPWLATCVGFHNRKAFILFLIYTCLFCWMAFASAATWFWSELVTEGFHDQLMPVNYILLAVIAGVIGLVLSGFTGWHIWLAFSGQTTIESLEKTRYLTPIRKSMQEQTERTSNANGGLTLGEQLREIHANAIPGVTRPEEGEERSSPARDSLRQNFADAEYHREAQRYQDYLDEEDSSKLPNAFNLGWRRNLSQLFGEKPLLWMLPICNSTGDGWRWEASPKWLEAHNQLANTREARLREQQAWNRDRESSHTIGPNTGFRGHHMPQINPRTSSMPGSHVSMNTLDANKPFDDGREQDYESSSDEDDHTLEERRNFLKHQSSITATDNWNDIPDELLGRSQGGQPARVPSRQRRHGNAG